MNAQFSREGKWRARARLADRNEPREPDPERFLDFQHEFEPPVFLARRTADFRRSPDGGVLHLTGPGRAGKSRATQSLDDATRLPVVLGRAIPLPHVSMHGPPAPNADPMRRWPAKVQCNFIRLTVHRRWQISDKIQVTPPTWRDIMLAFCHAFATQARLPISYAPEPWRMDTDRNLLFGVFALQADL